MESKTKAKKVEVRLKNDEHDPKHKNFCDQFSGGYKVEMENKCKEGRESVSKHPADDVVSIIKNKKVLHSTKNLKRKLKQMKKENNLLVKRLDLNDQIYEKKINESKKILDSFNKYNEELLQENRSLRSQCENVMEKFHSCKRDLEDIKQKYYCLNERLKLTSFDLEKTQNKNQELENDSQMLKTIIYRLNVHLERYQEKLNKSTSSPTKFELHLGNTSHSQGDVLSKINHEDHSHVPVTWGKVNSHTLGPLLDAYDEAVSEKETLISEYEKQMTDFAIKFKTIVEENETLHKKLTEDENCSEKLKAKLEILAVELKTMKEQNDLLEKKCLLKQKKIDEILDVYQQKVTSMKRDHNILLDHYQKCQQEIHALNEKNKILSEIQAETKKDQENFVPVKIHEASVNECKRLYEDLKVQYENEKCKLSSNVTLLSEEIDNLKKQISSFDSDKESFQRQLQQKELALKNLKRKLRGSREVLRTIQSQKNAVRKQLHKTMAFARDLVDEHEKLLKSINIPDKGSKTKGVVTFKVDDCNIRSENVKFN